MKIITIFIALLIAFCSYSQMRPIDKVYIVEGMVADRETLNIIPSAILYNDSLGITTTSDERGYYKLVVPYDLIKERRLIRIDVLKAGYKRNGWGIRLNHAEADTNNVNPNNDSKEIWNGDVQILLMASNESQSSSTSMAHIPAKSGSHGYPMIKLTFDQAVASQRWTRKLEELKKGNEKVYFTIDGHVCLATSSYDMYFDDSSPIVFIDDKRVKLAEINKMVKRSEITVNDAKSEFLSKKYGKDVIAIKVNSLGATNEN